MSGHCLDTIIIIKSWDLNLGLVEFICELRIFRKLRKSLMQFIVVRISSKFSIFRRSKFDLFFEHLTSRYSFGWNSLAKKYFRRSFRLEDHGNSYHFGTISMEKYIFFIDPSINYLVIFTWTRMVYFLSQFGTLHRNNRLLVRLSVTHELNPRRLTFHRLKNNGSVEFNVSRNVSTFGQIISNLSPWLTLICKYPSRCRNLKLTVIFCGRFKP